MRKYAYWALDAYPIAIILYMWNFDSLETQNFIILIFKYDILILIYECFFRLLDIKKFENASLSGIFRILTDNVIYRR